MRKSVRSIVTISISVLIGILAGWLLSDMKKAAKVNRDNELLMYFLKRNDGVNDALVEVDHHTQILYKRINRALVDLPKTASPDSIVDLLHHTAAVINICSDFSSMVRHVYESDSIAVENYKKQKQWSVK